MRLCMLVILRLSTHSFKYCRPMGGCHPNLWKCIIAFQGYRFKTISGLPFSYKIKTGRNGELTKELWIDRRESSKSLTWSSVLLAFEKTEGKPLVKRPKALGDIRGASYIYGMFYRFGLIEVPVKQDKLRSNPISGLTKTNIVLI